MTALWTTHGRLREIHGDLLTAREEEGTRIARELHDDVGQRLALVSIGSAGSGVPSRTRNPCPPVTSADCRNRPAGSRVPCASCRISFIPPRWTTWASRLRCRCRMCDEVARVTGLEVRLASEGETTTLPQDIALGLYRVTQEALANVVRHAGARSVSVVSTAQTRQFLSGLPMTDAASWRAPGKRGPVSGCTRRWSGFGCWAVR